MVNLYRTLILLGRLTLEQVPEHWLSGVEALLVAPEETNSNL